MAERIAQKGTHSQLLAVTALIAHGWDVAEPYVTEAYDLVARAPGAQEWSTLQVKTARIREERGDAVVIKGTRTNGLPYSPDEVDYMVGVMPDGSVYIFECRGLKEYWASPNTVAKWEKLTVDFGELRQA